MTLREMIKIACAEPFRAFRIQMDDGSTFHVTDPEMFALGKSKILLRTWMSDYEEEAKTQELLLYMSHITSVQILD
jgi:hypothetical protein